MASPATPETAKQPDGAAPSRQPSSQPVQRVEIPRTIVTPEDTASLPELFWVAVKQYRDGKLEEAAQSFERLYRVDSKSALAPYCVFNAAHARDELGELPRALSGYETVAERHTGHGLVREALLRATRIAMFLERWKRAGELATKLDGYAPLRTFEGIVAHSAHALALLDRDALSKAETHIEKARTTVEDKRLNAAGKLSRDLAQLYFALGELRRRRGEKIGFNPPPADFATVLERRCQLLLDAQSAYSDTMRAYDAHWSAMAGFRVGQLYKRLHEDLMAVPAPKTADDEAKRQLFEGAMRLRYSILLTKGLSMMEHTLAMAKRVGEKSAWVKRAAAAKLELRQAIVREDAAIGRLPYTKAQLRQALEDLKKKAQARAKADNPNT